MRRSRAAVFSLAVLLAAASLPAAAPAAGEPVTVFAAASLTDAMSNAGKAFGAKTGIDIRFSFASSSTLARQIEAGAPAHIYASAHQSWMDYLENRGLIVAETRSSPIANRLALIAPVAARLGAVAADKTLDLPALLGEDGRLAVGDPEHVPAGIYAKEALTNLGLWAEAEPRLARTDNVRGALALVERGEAPLGISYATDAAISEGVVVVGLFPSQSHTPITYPFALVSGAGTVEAREFLAFLTGEPGFAIFESFGFARPE